MASSSKKILLTTCVPKYNHIKKDTTRQLIGGTILTSYSFKNSYCIQIFNGRLAGRWKVFAAQEDANLVKDNKLTEKELLTEQSMLLLKLAHTQN